MYKRGGVLAAAANAYIAARARSGNHSGYVASREKALCFAHFNLNRRMMNTKAVRDTLCMGLEEGTRE